MSRGRGGLTTLTHGLGYTVYGLGKPLRGFPPI